MNKKRYVLLTIILINQCLGTSNFVTESYSSSSSSQERMINGKVVKSEKSNISSSNKMAGKDGKILYQKSDNNQDEQMNDPLLGLKASGEDYFNYNARSSIDKKMIKLVSGSCAISDLGSGFSDNQIGIVKKNAARSASGDFLFGIFSSSRDAVTNNAEASLVKAFHQGENKPDIEIMIDALEDIKEFSDSNNYKDSFGIGMGILRDFISKKTLTIWCPFNCRAAIFSKRNISEYDDMTSLVISKGDIIIFGTNNFWEKVDSAEAIKIARKNLKKSSYTKSAVDVAEKLIINARTRGCNHAMNVLVIYIL